MYSLPDRPWVGFQMRQSFPLLAYENSCLKSMVLKLWVMISCISDMYIMIYNSSKIQVMK